MKHCMIQNASTNTVIFGIIAGFWFLTQTLEASISPVQSAANLSMSAIHIVFSVQNCIEPCVPCYVPYNVPQQDIPCPACSWESGCNGEATSILSCSFWRSAAEGELGYCNNPTKTGENLIMYFPCTDNYDISKILWCAAKATGCAVACAGASWPACVACLVVAGVDCGGAGWCIFIESCDPDMDNMRWSDIEDVVDWGGDLGEGCIG